MQGTILSYRDLKVWQRAMDLTVAVYRLTADFPREEQFGLTSPARRAATSIPANIAEGYGRDSRASYINFLRIAQGSLKELETHLILAAQVEITTPTAIEALLDEPDQIGKMLRALITTLLRPNP